jgi:rSAM/selenodomain-associated transferase 2
MRKRKISIIIPVFNEPDINLALEELQHQKYPDFEILVVDGDDIGSTIDLIENDSIIKFKSSKGRASQMNLGAQKANGDILLFLHADSRLPENGLEKINKIISSGYNVGCFDIKFQSKNWILREIISRTSSLRGRITRLPYGDQAFFFTKVFFQKINGFPDVPIMEDISIMQKVIKFREKMFIIPEPVLTSDRRWKDEGTLFVMVRNPVISMLYLLGIAPKKLKKFYK